MSKYFIAPYSSATATYALEIEHEKVRKATKMKLKSIPLLAGAITSLTASLFASTLSFANALTIAAAPLAVKAESSQLSQRLPEYAQNRPQSQPTPAGLQLTQQQQNQLAQLRRDTRAQIEKVLTPQQQKQFQSAVQSGGDPRTAFSAVNLSPAQQTQLQKIIQSAQTRAEAILTPQQRQQIQRYIQEQRQQQKQ